MNSFIRLIKFPQHCSSLLNFIVILLLVQLHFHAGVLALTIPEELPPSDESALFFVKNEGQLIDQHNQLRNDIVYYVNSNDLRLQFKRNGMSYELFQITSDETENEIIRTSRVDIEWLHCNTQSKIKSNEAIASYENYYLAHCPEGIRNVPLFSEIVYQHVYPSIDLKWYKQNEQLEYDFIIHPYADPKNIRWKISGAENIAVNERGELVITTVNGKIIESAPKAFQDGKMVNINWRIIDSIVSFKIGKYNRAKTLIIDPIVQIWGSYYGGIGDDRISSSAMDQNGAIYVTGHTSSLNHIATSGSHQNTFGGTTPLSDAYLARFDTNGTRIWATYYGGTGSDQGNDCALSNSAVYIAGSTISTNAMSTLGTHQSAFGGGSHDGFLAKFDFSGARVWGTYFGGDEFDIVIGCAANDSMAFIVGRTESDTLIASSGSYQTTRAGNEDIFVACIDSGGQLKWGSYYGDVADDLGMDCAIDQSANVYFCGTTYSSSSSFTSTGSHQASSGGFSDGYLVKFSANGNRLWATYYGGSGSDGAVECEVDDSSFVYLTGNSSSSNAIATSGAFQSTLGGSTDAYVAKFNTNGTRIWSTYYGGTMADRGYDCAIDHQGGVYLTGYTNSTNAIATNGSHQTNYAGSSDGFVVKFTAGGSREWGTYFGGSDIDRGNTCLVDASLNVFLFGETKSSSDISTFGSHQDSLNGNFDGFLTMLYDCDLPEIDSVLGGEICDSGMITLYASATFGDLQWFEDSLGGLSISSDSLYTTMSLNESKIFYVNAANGKCQSERVAVLAEVLYSSDTSFVDSGCYWYVSPGGNTYTTSGIYVDTIGNFAGCDSIIEIELTIKSVDTQVQKNGNQLTANTGPAVYQWIECSSGPISGATAQSYNVISNGSYAVIITQNGCTDTSACFDFTNVGIAPISLNRPQINVFPNPTNEQIKIDFGTNIDKGELCLKDLTGKNMGCWNIANEYTKILYLNFPKGMYVFILTTNEWVESFPVSIR